MWAGRGRIIRREMRECPLKSKGSSVVLLTVPVI